MTGPAHRSPTTLVALLSVAFVVSIVHYVDNTLNYDDFPVLPADRSLPNPAVEVVAGAWFVFTAFGLLGLWLFSRNRIAAAAVALAVYSGSGLVGIAHYLVPGATDMVWWRQAHVITDIVLGALVFAFAIRLATTQRREGPGAEAPRPS
ncbi:MAG: hypothetical protein ACR2FE_11895 [Aeromicrobium sp.]